MSSTKEWHRQIEPEYIPCEWREHDIVVTFVCCDYPVLIGKRTKLDIRRGFSQLGRLPAQCPCKCAYLFRGKLVSDAQRNVKSVIHPIINSPDPFDSVRVYEGTYITPYYDLVIRYDNFFAIPTIEQ